MKPDRRFREPEPLIDRDDVDDALELLHRLVIALEKIVNKPGPPPGPPGGPP